MMRECRLTEIQDPLDAVFDEHFVEVDEQAQGKIQYF
jgi:hypothetical protein